MGVNYRGLSIPFTQMGRVTSDNLFDPNEQIIFDFYEANKTRYRKAVDIGANIGVHSILMARLGWVVWAFEPDPVHFAHLTKNIEAHDVLVNAVEAAVSDRAGRAPFVRVLNNTTGSHLQGAKDSYGPRDTIDVSMVNCRALFDWADFAKIDCEGHEDVLMNATTSATWRQLDALLEVGNEQNASAIYNHLIDVVPMWAQKIGWARVGRLSDMPTHHREGSLFIGGNKPW